MENRTPTRTRTRRHNQRTQALLLGLLLSVLLIACGETSSSPTDPSQPVVPPGEATGSLQVTVEGLPEGADARILVAGPEDYSAMVTGSQTLEDLRTGSYTLEVEAVEYDGQSYSGLFEATRQAETAVDVTEGDPTEVTVTYTRNPEGNAIAPGVTREGLVAEDAFDDYTFEGSENVPVTFDFEGTGGEAGGQYTVLIYNAEDLDEPLFNSYNQGTAVQAPVFGFTPPQDGEYILRIRGVSGIAEYEVTMNHLNGPPEERQEPTVLEYGDTATGAVTTDSYDTYRFTGTFNETILLNFSYDISDSRYNGSYRVEFYRVGEDEPLDTTYNYSTFAAPPELTFTPQEDGEYLIRVVGTSTPGISLVRYSFALERLE